LSDVAERLERALPGRVKSDAKTLAAHRHDSWVLAELLDQEGAPGSDPVAVVEPRSTEEVAIALRTCREARAPLVPFGGGSGVCGAIRAVPGAVVLSTRAMSGLVELDDASLVAAFRAGTGGMDAERRVQQAALTIGHWPQSIELSTVGGWVATRASGQFSTAYGNIEDIVLGLEVVLPDGAVLRTRRTPRASAGPDLRHLFLGSEGTLGVVTQVELSLRPLPEDRRPQAFSFASFDAGLEAIRAAIRAGWHPPVVRLYDAAEAQRSFAAFCPEGRALLVLLHEGPRGLVAAGSQALDAHAAAAGGREADPAAVLQWLDRRNHVPSFRELLERGLIVDTIEMAATWDRVGELYRRVTEALRAVPHVLLASSHSSHSYRSGTCLYFTFAARPDDPRERRAIYESCWRKAIDAAVALGAGISHHHGIGRVRRDRLADEIGSTGVAVLRAVKRALDPDGLLNPGALLPD
jgi:alkyldihydroxyacetonephosphate synthase